MEGSSSFTCASERKNGWKITGTVGQIFKQKIIPNLPTLSFIRLNTDTMPLGLIMALLCGLSAVPLQWSFFTEHLSIRPLKDGNMLLDFTFDMNFLLKRRCVRPPHTLNDTNVFPPSESCVSQNLDAPLELAQMYTQWPAEVSAVYLSSGAQVVFFPQKSSFFTDRKVTYYPHTGLVAP